MREWELTLDLIWFSLQQWVFDTSLQKFANVIPTAAVKQDAKVHGPLVSFVLFNMGPNVSENIKTLSLLQTLPLLHSRMFHTSSGFAAQWSSPKKNTSNISKSSVCRVKQSRIWDQEVVVQHIWGTLTLYAFNVIWGHLMFLECDFSDNTIFKTLLHLRFNTNPVQPNFLQLFLLALHIKVAYWNYES